MALDPAVAAVRRAVREVLRPSSPPRADPAGGAPVLVACSGGADSLALLAASVFERREARRRVIGVVVDHGLQEGSGPHTAGIVEQMAALGADETASIRVRVDAGPRGIEAGAREARYAALQQIAQHFRADTVLLGHTRDDQAETVLLGLTRGSGGRSIAGMRRRFHREEPPPGERGVVFVRPMLDITRTQTEDACRAQGIEWWSDPHNADPRFVRSRIRHTVLPMLERELGPGVAAALARTADGLREDVAALDDWAERELGRQYRAGRLDVGPLRARPDALRLRVLRLAALDAGALAGELSREHVLALDDLMRAPERPPRRIDLPGHVTALRDGDVLLLRRRDGTSGDAHRGGTPG